jgi:flagellar motor switch protein FliM
VDNVLSQSEVNALLNALNQGSISGGGEEARNEAGVKGYDLTSNDRIIRGRMPTLDILNQRLARLMRISLFNMFRKQVEVTHDATQLVKYSEFIASVSVPACLNIFRMPPLRNTCLISVDSNLMFGLVDVVFGGTGGWYRVEGREYSNIELRLIKQVITLVLNDVGTAWEPVLEVRPEYLRTEVNPQFASISSPSDVVINVVFDVELEGAAKGTISLLIPYTVIEPIRPLLSSALQTERNQADNAWRGEIREVLETLEVELVATLGTGHVTLRDLMSLKPGDTVRLSHDANEPLACQVEGVPKVYGHPVMSRGKLAVKLVQPPGDPPPRSASIVNSNVSSLIPSDGRGGSR